MSAAQSFGLDAVTCYSEAFRVSIDLGVKAVYPEDSPPRISRPLVVSGADIAALRRPDSLKARSRMADRVADILQSDPEECERKTLDRLRSARGSRYMVSAGCEIPAAAKDEVFRAFCGASAKCEA